MTEKETTKTETGELSWKTLEQVAVFCASLLLVVGTFAGCVSLVRLAF